MIEKAPLTLPDVPSRGIAKSLQQGIARASAADDPTAVTYAELQLIYRTFNDELFGGQLPECLITLQREKRTMGYFSRNRFATRKGHITDEIAINPEFFAVTPVIETFQTIAHEMCHLWQAHFGKPGRGRYHNEEWACKMESIGLMPSSTGKPGGARTGDRVSDYVMPGKKLAQVVRIMMQKGFEGITWHDRLTPYGVQHILEHHAGMVSLASAQYQELALATPGEDGDDGSLPSFAEGIPALCGVPISPKNLASNAGASNEGMTVTANRSLRVKYSCPTCGLNAWAKPRARFACLDCDQQLLAQDGTADAPE